MSLFNSDYDKCPDCETYWVSCPCCSTEFCNDCGQLESEVAWHDKEDTDE